jgi:hypothetical protein
MLLEAVARKGHRAKGKLHAYSAHNENSRNGKGFRGLTHEKNDGLKLGDRRMRGPRKSNTVRLACDAKGDTGHQDRVAYATPPG